MSFLRQVQNQRQFFSSGGLLLGLGVLGYTVNQSLFNGKK